MLGPSMLYAGAPMALAYTTRARRKAPERGLATSAWILSVIASLVLGLLIVLWVSSWFSEEGVSAITESWKRIDTVVVGRKTYEPVLKSGKPWPSYPGVKNYVFSRTIRESPDKNVQIISEDAAEFIRKLKSENGKDIFVMGGGELAKSLFEANVIDEIRLSIHPHLSREAARRPNTDE